MRILASIVAAIYFLKPISCDNPCNVCGRTLSYTSEDTALYRDRKKSPAIINGHETSSLAFPWEVLLVQDTQGLRVTCTGAIISRAFILTAAHCVINQDPSLKCTDRNGHPKQECWASTDSLSASKHNWAFYFPIDSVFPHPDFELPDYHNDIALVRLKDPINCRFGVMPICLPVPLYNGFHKNLQIAGFGKFSSRHEKTNGPSKFRKGMMQMVDAGVCDKYFGTLLPDSFICAMGNPSLRQSICEGDSGSAAFVDFKGVYFALGVTSLFGGDDCTPNKPSVFTRISSYVNWIRHVVPDLPNPSARALTKAK